MDATTLASLIIVLASSLTSPSSSKIFGLQKTVRRIFALVVLPAVIYLGV